jgi:hypothetical protein
MLQRGSDNVLSLPNEQIAVSSASGAGRKRRHIGVASSPFARALRPMATLLGFDGNAVVVEAGEQKSIGVGWMPALALNAGAVLFIGAVAANASRAGADWAVGLFYLSIAIIFFPIAARAAYPDLSRNERIALVLTATVALFVARIIRAPVAFIDHDEFLHWLTVNDILEQGGLFTPNALLPVSPRYPGLEIATTAIAELTGMSVFGSAMLLLATCRVVFMAALFLTFEKIAASPRVAAIACMLYMGSSTFFVFDSHFSYESLAVVFLVLAILSDVVSEAAPEKSWRISLVLTLPFLTALAVTHHMTAFFAAGLFAVLAGLQLVKVPASTFPTRSIVVAAFAIAVPMIWSSMMGHPTANYLGPVIEDGLRELTQLFSSSQGRELFVSEDGSVAPAWQRAVAIGSVAFVCCGLATGFLRSLAYAGLKIYPSILNSLRSARSRNNSRMVLFTFLTLAYPLSILFRLTRSGWEIGNRIGPFSFLGVSLVVAIGVASFWESNSKLVARYVLVAAAATVIFVGGIISAEGPRILVPSQFHVSADAASVEAMGIATAKWSRSWIGPHNLFASDRINRLLLATYGRQQVATTLQDARDVSTAIQSERLGPSQIALLRQLGIEYVLADLRLTTALPVVGVYFDGGAADRAHATPLAAKALLKFNFESSVSRPFDNGYQIIFDVRRLDGER